MSVQKEGAVPTKSEHQPFHFQGESRYSVVLSHNYGKYLRSNPDAPVKASGHGGKSRFAQWQLHAFGSGFCKLRNVQSGKYLRIIPCKPEHANNTALSGDKVVDVGGTGGVYTLFRVQTHDAYNVSLESVKFAGYFVAVSGQYSVYALKHSGGQRNVGVDKDAYFRFESQDDAEEKQESVASPLRASMAVIQHALGQYVRVNPDNMSNANAHGGRGQFARWNIEVCKHESAGVSLIKFQNTKTGKYLRIVCNHGIYECDVRGTGGAFTVFRYNAMQQTLESNRFAGQFLAIGCDSLDLAVCDRAHAAQQNGHTHVLYFNIVYLDNTATATTTTTSVVCIAHKFGKHLRVNPGREQAIDGHGGCGRFARWSMEHFDNECVKFKSTKSGRYLRIIDGTPQRVVDVGGGGGRYTLFRWNATQRTLESTVFPGHYLAVHREQNTVMCAQRESELVSIRFELKTKLAKLAKSKFDVPFNFHMHRGRQGGNPVVVVVKSNVHALSVRVNPKNLQKSNALGGCGQFARWQLIECGTGGDKVYKLQSCKSNRYLRIAPSAAQNQACGDIDVCGSGGKFTQFRVHVVSDCNAVVFESVVFSGKYLAANAENGEMYVCQNLHDKHCVFRVFTTRVAADDQGGANHISDDNTAAVIESQRTLIEQQKMLIDQLQKTVVTQQQIIHSLQSQEQQRNGRNVPLSTLQNDENDVGEQDEDEYEYIANPGCTHK